MAAFDRSERIADRVDPPFTPDHGTRHAQPWGRRQAVNTERDRGIENALQGAAMPARVSDGFLERIRGHQRIQDPRLRSPDRRAADDSRAKCRRGDVRLERPDDGPSERLRNRACIWHNGREGMMRGTQNAIGHLHIVEVSGRERSISVMRRVFARRLLICNVACLHGMTNLMHMRRYDPAQHEGQQE